MQFIGKFYGPEEILEVRDTGTTTHRGISIIEIITRRQGTEDKTRLTTTTLSAINLLATETAMDWNYLQDVKLDAVVKDIMAIATDSGVSGSELNPLLSKLGLALATRFEHASHIKFEGNDDEFVPGGNEYHTWSLAKAEYIIVNKNVDTSEETTS